MTTDTIHTCSYSCERPGCIRAQRDELAARLMLRFDLSPEALREALEEIRSRSAINLAMHPNPFELTARLGDIYQIADGALAKENRSD